MSHPSAGTIFVSTAYELGARVQDGDAKALVDALAERGIRAEPSVEAANALNVSYAMARPPVLRARIGDEPLRLGERETTVGTDVVVYPWLGVCIVDQAIDAPTEDDLLGAHAAIVDAYIPAYFAWLVEHGVGADELATRFGRPAVDPRARSVISGLDGTVARVVAAAASLRDPVAPGVRYPFHNQRLSYLVHGSGADGSADPMLRSRLLVHDHEWAHLDEDPVPELVAGLANAQDLPLPGGLHVASNGWSTVVEARRDDTRVGRIRGVQRLVHAQWFLCQLCAYTGFDIDQSAASGARGELLSRIERLADQRHEMLANLSEIDNIDIMLRDPVLRTVANRLVELYRIPEHRTVAERRLESLSDTLASEFARRNTQQADKLQHLFALSAAAGLAGLIATAANPSPVTGAIAIVIVLTFVLVYIRFTRESTAVARTAAAEASDG